MRRPAFGQPPSPQGEGQESSRPGGDGEDALRALPGHGGEDALRCKRQAKSPALRPGFCLFGILRAAYAASSATAASPSPSPSLSDSLSAPASASGLAPRRGLLASWASISFTASVSVTCCTTAISRDSRSSAAS